MQHRLIVLRHVAQDADYGALPGLTERYRAAGYNTVTVEQLIQPGLIATFHDSSPLGDPDSRSHCTPTPYALAASRHSTTSD